MPTKTEFKFDCPTCGQHILAATEWCGRKINCPSCETGINIPELPKEKKKAAPVMPPRPATHPNYSSRPIRVEVPAKAKVVASSNPKAKGILSSYTEPKELRVAVLTPALKLEMVRAVRKRITSAAAWMPGKLKGVLAYAAKVSAGETVLINFKDPKATRFSLLGAFLLELHQRNVTRTATGRTRLLDQEIPDAIRDVLGENQNTEAREAIEAMPASQSLIGVSTHKQCLAVLDVLEARYSNRMDQIHAEQAKRKLGTTRLPDLVKKLEKKARIESADVATALYHELMEINRRLDRIESQASGNK